MYQLKQPYSGQWVEICGDELNVCSQTANSYISFFELVGCNPRIIIFELHSSLRGQRVNESVVS